MNAVLGKLASTAQELAHYHSGDGIGFLNKWYNICKCEDESRVSGN